MTSETTTTESIVGDQRTERLLRGLKNGVNGVAGSLLASPDGRTIAADLTDHGHQQTAAIVASSLGLGSRLAELTGKAELEEIVVRSATGYVVIYSVGSVGALIVLTRPAANLALLHLKARDVIQALGVL